MTIPILYCLVVGSAITDILKSKIFNGWLLLGCMARLFLCLFGNGIQETPFWPMARACLMLLVLLPVYLIRGIGGGDLKLFAVLSMFLSSGELVSSVIIAFFIAAFIGIFKAFISKKTPCTIHFAVPILISVLLVTGGGITCT